MDSPLKVATPDTAATVTVPARVPAPDDVVNVTDADADSSTFPPASMKDTTGWVAKTAPATVLDGLVSKLSAVAVPADMVKLLDCTLMTVDSSVDSVALAARM